MIIVFLILEAMSNTSYTSTNSSIISKQLPNLLVISYEAINSFSFISMDTKLMQDHFLLGSDTSTVGALNHVVNKLITFVLYDDSFYSQLVNFISRIF